MGGGKEITRRKWNLLKLSPYTSGIRKKNTTSVRLKLESVDVRGG